jgi:hypothetical protein
MLPWAFLDFELSLVEPPAIVGTEALTILFGVPTEAGFLQTTHPPK